MHNSRRLLRHTAINSHLIYVGKLRWEFSCIPCIHPTLCIFTAFKRLVELPQKWGKRHSDAGTKFPPLSAFFCLTSIVYRLFFKGLRALRALKALKAPFLLFLLFLPSQTPPPNGTSPNLGEEYLGEEWSGGTGNKKSRGLGPLLAGKKVGFVANVLLLFLLHSSQSVCCGCCVCGWHSGTPNLQLFYGRYSLLSSSAMRFW